MNPPKEIDDASDVKPSDWVESPKITDPEAVKPEDWDEDAPQYIDDPEAVKPEDWLEDEEATVPDPEAEVCPPPPILTALGKEADINPGASRNLKSGLMKMMEIGSHLPYQTLNAKMFLDVDLGLFLKSSIPSSRESGLLLLLITR